MKINTIKRKLMDDGYVLIKNFYRKEELKPLIDEIISLSSVFPQLDSFSPFGRQETDQVYSEKEMSMMYSNLRYLPTLAKLSTSSKNLKLNTDLGLKFPLVMKSCNIRMDRPFNVKHLFHWHQDIVYLLGSMNALTFWIPLTSVNKENGSVEIVPKSHTKGILPVDCLDQQKADQGGVMSPQDLRLRDEVQGDSIIIDANLGDLVVFSQKLLHRSTPNFNKKIRYTVQLRYSDCMDEKFIEAACPMGDNNIFNTNYI
jgi:ectoine hydroxylase-related dioxygenase (phytanoyl-CoA dioxygenase family)